MHDKNELVEVFKVSNPDQKMMADHSQLAAHPKKLVKWEDREKWLANKAGKSKGGKGAGTSQGNSKGPNPAKTGADATGGQPAGGTGQENPEDKGPSRGDLIAKAEKLGINIHPQMKTENIAKKIAEVEASKK